MHILTRTEKSRDPQGDCWRSLMGDSNKVPTEPDLERRTRRCVSVAEKKQLLAEVDGATYGEIYPWFRQSDAKPR